MTKLQSLSRLCTSFQAKLLIKRASPSHFGEWRALSTSYSWRLQISSSCHNEKDHSKSSRAGANDPANMTEGSKESKLLKENNIGETEWDCSLRKSEKLNDSFSSETEGRSPPSSSGPLEQVNILQNSRDNDSPSAVKIITVVPGKGRPPEPPTTCCGTGCANCVWIVYAEELRDYYKDGGAEAKKALEKIDDPSLKAFIKLELGLR
ncbi:hypothetical protein RRG08_025258 [Elysia crispata]|uniref:Oxidoreductase-like domain-containing protein n=1 Tax=Elysia crispata TaxID=231223 RepID=A0AAE1DVP1_9GAST|nr:hypothetical protein RRG08_025258 [Elysia crispata]